MKSLTVQVMLDDQDAELLASKYLIKELEGLCIRECLHVLGSLANDIKSKIPLVEPMAHELLEEQL